ncbi:unnamed protein product [Caenorhabditis sp. 36 PRJEB53466]|nr:unnamed protein product [Caenorhabditis sp. 36 PRJEB53466]
MWRRFMPIAIAIVLLTPFLVIWNVIISDAFPAPIFGGFTLTYSKRVRWASLSLFQMSLMLLAVSITVASTLVTLLKMRRLENRLKSSERTLCLASFYISAGFLAAALFQASLHAFSYFAFVGITAASTDLFYFLQGFSFDVLNVGSPIVMLFLSAQLRYHVIPVKMMVSRKATVVSVTSIWRRMMPFTAAIIALSPLLVIWNIIISDVFPASSFGGFGVAYSKRVPWASLSLFHLVFMLLAVSITVASTLSYFAFFFVPGTNVGIFYFLQGFSFDVLNVGSPVVMLSLSAQLRYHVIPNWRRFVPYSLAIIVFSPLLVIWNVIISNVYPIPVFGGFTLTYTKRVRWASLSLFQMSLMLLAVSITVASTLVTLLKMRRLENRLKSSERTLCLASFYISAGFLAAALFQASLHAFCCFAFLNTTSALAIVYFLQYFVSDALNVGSPLVMLLLSAQLRNHVIRVKRSPATTSTISVSSAAAKCS